MAVATTASTLVSNSEALPRTYNDAALAGGKKRTFVGTLETAAADDAGSQYILCKLNPEWAVTSIKLFTDGVTNMTTADVGLYTGTAYASLTAADIDCYASAVDMSAANVTGTVVTTYKDFAFEARDIANMGQKVYQDAGDSLGDFSQYYLVITATTNDPTAAATISFVVDVIAE